MYDPKKKLPRVGEDVMVLLETVDGPVYHEGHLTRNGDKHQWHIHAFDLWYGEVLGWKYKSSVDEFTFRFLFFALGFASAVILTYAAVLAMGG